MNSASDNSFVSGPATPVSAAGAWRARRGFTLIELLTVIAIIGILAAIIIPVVGSVRRKAREAQGVSNLRQIVVGALAYAQDNRDFLPWGFDGSNNSAFSTEIGGYLNRGTGKYNDAASRSVLFLDPLVSASATATNHFSGNQALLPNRADEAVHPRYQLTRSATRLSELVLIADGGLNASGEANATLNRLHSLGVSRRAPFDPTRADHDTTLRADMGTNLDDGTAVGWIRWRMSGDRAKFGFLDGHVSVLDPDNIRRRNFRPN